MQENFEQILESTPLLAMIFKNASANAMLIMDVEGYILNCNEAFTHAFGYTKEDLLGKHARLLFTEEDQLRRMPEMEIETVNQLYTAIDKNYTVHKDGTCIWVTGESILANTEDGKKFIIKIIQNIHEQKVLEKFLKESTEFSESVVKSIDDAIIVLDIDSRILKVNNAFYNLFKINQQTVEGLFISEITHPMLQGDEVKFHFDKALLTGTTEEFQLQRTIDNTQTKHFGVKASLIDGQLVNKRILFVVRDITEKLQQEQRRDDLVGFVIHELRNPLANITLCNTLLEEAIKDKDLESAREYLEMSKTSAGRLKSLIHELYEATKAGAGNLQFHKTAFAFRELVREVIEPLQLLHPAYKIVIKGSADFEVTADKERLSQVLGNYLSNAIKYSAGANRVEVQISIEDGNAIVAVTDFGKGIPEIEMVHLFERYYRVKKTNKIDGLGLGLFLSKQIIDAHNGRVWVNSKENEGSTFYFSIPLV